MARKSKDDEYPKVTIPRGIARITVHTTKQLTKQAAKALKIKGKKK
jgi:Arc/MetJ family transcription regulator